MKTKKPGFFAPESRQAESTFNLIYWMVLAVYRITWKRRDVLRDAPDWMLVYILDGDVVARAAAAGAKMHILIHSAASAERNTRTWSHK